MAEYASYIERSLPGESRSLLTLLGFSLLAHVLFFVLDKADFLMERKPLFDEWEIEAELISDINLGAPANTNAMPDAEKAKDIAVPEKLLPQLPKKFTVKDEENPEDIVSEKVNKDALGNKPVGGEKVDIKTENKDNVLKQNDALKRLAIERLRRENKTAKTLKAEEKDPLAKLKEELSKNGRLAMAGSQVVAGEAMKVYRLKLRKHIGRFWSVPESYNIKKANLLVTIGVVINTKGNLATSKIKNSSGDHVFDKFAYDAVLNSVPLPNPPEGQVGKEILLKFSPGSF